MSVQRHARPGGWCDRASRDPGRGRPGIHFSVV